MGDPNIPDTKTRAKRVDHRYFRRRQPWRSGRRWLVVLFCAAVLIWLGASSFRFGKNGVPVFTPVIHNPGHVTAAHAMIENDCIQCHDGNGHGGFLKTVSDTACLKCHDAGIHNLKQKEYVATVKLAANTQPSAADQAALAAGLPLDNHPAPLATQPATPTTQTAAAADQSAAPVVQPPGLRSMDCVHCHTEHQGEAALLGTNVRLCLECHADLKDHDLDAPGVQAKVVAFDGAGGHPHFGTHPDPAGVLVFADNKLSNRTQLKFNHAFHNTQQGLQNNCVACHTPMSPSASATHSVVPGEPLALAKDRPLSSGEQEKVGDMQPITFERNCIQCHPLLLTGGVSVSHHAMAIVRSELSSIPSLIAAQSVLTADDMTDSSVDPPVQLTSAAAAWKAKIAKLAAQCATMKDPPSVAAGAADDEASTAATPNTKTYAQEKAAALRYLDWLIQSTPSGATPVAKTTTDSDSNVQFVATTQQSFGSDSYSTREPNVAEIYMAYIGAKGGSCNFCHMMNGGDVPTGFQYKLSMAATQPATAAPTSTPSAISTVAAMLPSSQPAFLDVQPTGIPSSPQHWYANSHFDHSAHRDLSCYNCHANAWDSTLTSDVLLPDIGYSENVPKGKLGPDGKEVKSCVDCHGPPPSRNELSAPSNCITCHAYHDRTKEDSLDASLREQHHASTMPST